MPCTSLSLRHIEFWQISIVSCTQTHLRRSHTQSSGMSIIISQADKLCKQCPWITCISNDFSLPPNNSLATASVLQLCHNNDKHTHKKSNSFIVPHIYVLETKQNKKKTHHTYKRQTAANKTLPETHCQQFSRKYNKIYFPLLSSYRQNRTKWVPYHEPW